MGNIINEVELFEINKNENVVSSSTLYIQHVNTAIHNITNATDSLNPTHSMSDFEPENYYLIMRLNFLLDQLKYLIVDKHARRYSILTQVLCLKIHGISPACYRLIHGSNCKIHPHECNLLKIKNSIGLESEYTKILEVASTFSDLERHVILFFCFRERENEESSRVINELSHLSIYLFISSSVLIVIYH